MKWSDIRHLDGYLPPDMEESYRLYYLNRDISVAGTAMVFFAILLVAFSYSDYLIFNFSMPFYYLLILRVLYLVIFIFVFLYLRRRLNPAKFDNYVFSLLILGIILVAVINISRPENYASNLAVDIVIILLIYLGLPIRQLFRVISGVVFTLLEIFIFFFFRNLESILVVYSSMVSLIMANVVGIFASGLLHSLRRSEYRERIARQRIADEWQATFDSITDLISIQDKDCKLVRVNKAYADAFHMSPDQLIGKNCYEVIHATQNPIDNCPHIKTIDTEKPERVEIFEPRLGLYLEVSTSPIFDDNGKLVNTVHLAKDITVRKQMENQLTMMATHDGLTGLPNRNLLNDRFNIAMAKAQRVKTGLALMVLDLDKFKTVNDTLGHANGDQLLRLMAVRLKDIMRKSDTIARIGGDEFVVLLPDILSPDDSIKTAQKILQSFNQPFMLDEHELNVTSSIGIAVYPENGSDIEELMNKADRAMYAAKESGRNTYRLFRE